MVKWWDKKYGKESVCGITRTRLRPGKNLEGYTYCVFLKCKHGFCRSALKKWVTIGGSTTCPMCRKYFDPMKAFI